MNERLARKTLEPLVSAALDALRRALQPRPSCPVCLRSDSDRDPAMIRAAQLVLDRALGRPVLTVQTVVADPNAWMQLVTDEQLATIKRWIEEALAPRVLLLPAGVEEGVIVDMVLSPGGLEPEHEQD
jgi:hypothetical protein